MATELGPHSSGKARGILTNSFFFFIRYGSEVKKKKVLGKICRSMNFWFGKKQEEGDVGEKEEEGEIAREEL